MADPTLAAGAGAAGGVVVARGRSSLAGKAVPVSALKTASGAAALRQRGMERAVAAGLRLDAPRPLSRGAIDRPGEMTFSTDPATPPPETEVQAAERVLASAEREQGFSLAEKLRPVGFPGAAFVSQQMPVRVQGEARPEIAEPTTGSYDDRKLRIHLNSAGDIPAIMAIDPRDAQSFSRATGAVKTLFHEINHHRQDQLRSEPWFGPLEEHYKQQIAQRRAESTMQRPLYTPNDSSKLARHYTFEAFAGYAGARAETWMQTRTTLQLTVEAHRDNPAELHRMLLVRKQNYEASIQQPGKNFGYAQSPERDGGGLWGQELFPLPGGALRAQIDAATRIPGSFEQAFPEFARLLAETAPAVEARP